MKIDKLLLESAVKAFIVRIHLGSAEGYELI